MEKENKQVNKKKVNRTNIIWTVALSLLSGLIFGLSFLLYSAYSTSNNFASSLESTYQKSYYDLVDKVNNMEVKLSKVVSSSDTNYTAKMLSEISKNAEDAQNNLNVLPVTLNGVEESLKFVNQVGGYTSTLSKRLQMGESLSKQDENTLEKLHGAVLNMKQSMSQMSEKMWKGYSIIDDGLSLDGNYNDLTVNLKSLKASDVDYPTMIYDGPFSDSQLKKEAKALTGQNISVTNAKKLLTDYFEITEDKIKEEGQAKSYIDTFDFSFQKSNINYYAQITVKDGKLYTLSSYNDSNQINFSKPEALEIAKAFIAKTGIENVECVWSDVVAKDAYFNFAPVQNGVIIYPDLIKAKVDLAHGEIVGYEANSYYTNHKERNLDTFDISIGQAREQVKSGYVIKDERKVLAPIDFEEILCYEFNTLNNGNIFYFYVDAQSGKLVNVLRIIRTTDGNKLM